MTFWDLKNGKRIEGSKIDYYFYKLQQLKERQEELNTKYYRETVSDIIYYIIEEMFKHE